MHRQSVLSLNNRPQQLPNVPENLNPIHIRLPQQSSRHRVPKKTKQLVVIPIEIHQVTRLRVNPKLRPSHNLHKLIQRPQPTRQRNKPICQLRHPRLALMHASHNIQPRKPAMRHLTILQRTRNNSKNLSPSRQRTISQRAHHPHMRATINHSDAICREPRTQRPRRHHQRSIIPTTRSAENANRSQGHKPH